MQIQCDSKWNCHEFMYFFAILWLQLAMTSCRDDLKLHHHRRQRKAASLRNKWILHCDKNNCKLFLLWKTNDLFPSIPLMRSVKNDETIDCVSEESLCASTLTCKPQKYEEWHNPDIRCAVSSRCSRGDFTWPTSLWCDTTLFTTAIRDGSG